MKKYILLTLLFGVLISCSDNDDTDIDLEGKWVLNEVSCFCFFGEDFDFSIHTLEFNTAENVVTIENSAETFFISNLGSSEFIIRDNVITINERKYRYQINGNSLTLSFVDNPDIADDEITLFYTRG